MNIIQPAKCSSTYQVVLSLSVSMALIYQGKDGVVFVFVFTLPNLVHIVGLIKCLLNEKMNHQQTLIGRLLCVIHWLSFFLAVASSAYSVQGLFNVLPSESCRRMRTVRVLYFTFS